MAENLGGPALAEAQKLLSSYLNPGEKLTWAERRSFAVSLRAFPLRMLFRFAALFFLFLMFCAVVLPLFFLENSDVTVFSFLLFNFLWIAIFVLEGIGLFRNHLRSLYALSNQRAFFIATKPFLEIDAVALHHLSDEKYQTYSTNGSLVFPHVRRWGQTQFAFQRNRTLGFFAVPKIAKALAALQAALGQQTPNKDILKAPFEAPALVLSRKPALLFQRLPRSIIKDILDSALKHHGYGATDEEIKWVGRPQMRSVVFTVSFLIRFSAALFFTGFIFLSLFYRQTVFSSSDFSTLIFLFIIWLYCLAPIIKISCQAYAFSSRRLYIISGWTKLTLRMIDLADVDSLQFLHRPKNRGSIGFGVLSQQFSADEVPVLLLNKTGFFHITKIRETQSLLQEAIRKARHDTLSTPSTPLTDTTAPAPRGG